MKTFLRVLLLTLAGASFAAGSAANYRYYRFRATALRGSVPYVQLSEFTLFNGSAQVTGGTASDPSPGSSPAAETAPNVLDGNLNTKWLDYDYTKGALFIDFGSPQVVTAYNFYTANDAPERDVTAWELAGTNDPNKLSWTVLDTRSGFNPPMARFTIFSATNFLLPAQPPAVVGEFAFDYGQNNLVANGAPVVLIASTSYATSSDVTSDAAGSTLIPVAQDDEAQVIVHPPANMLTTYTLTARSPDGNATRSLLVRTVPGALLSYRYLRFTPLALAKGGTTIDLDDFSFKNGSTAVPIAAVSSPGGSPIASMPLTNLIDSPTAATEWSAKNLAPVIFDFGPAPVSYSSYSYSSGSLAGQSPAKWILEGSNDSAAWTLVDNVFFKFTAPLSPHTATGDLPFSGAALVPYASLATDVAACASGEGVTLSWQILGAASAIISPGVGVVSGSGSAIVHPTTDTAYQISATNPQGFTGQASASVKVYPSIPVSLSYANFNDRSLMATNGSASILNDYARFTSAGDVNRLRLTDTGLRETGSTWYAIPLSLSYGFDTSFDAFVANNDYFNGAEGMAFVIQGTPETTAALPAAGAMALPNRAVSVVLDSDPDQPGESTSATLQVFQNDQRLAVVNLAAGGLGLAHGYRGLYLADYLNSAARPYHVHVVYVPGSMSVYVDGVLAIDRLPVSLTAASAVDAKGRSYVGFTGATGGLAEYHDVTAWSLTSSAAPAVPLQVTAFAFNAAASTLQITWASTSGKSYRITSSADLITWGSVGGPYAASSGSTSATVPCGGGGSLFFRIEEQ